MADKSVIIIGAGVAGLSSGCYCQMNGYRSRIFELHDSPGGLCTSWQRKGFTIDCCIHWLMGSKAGGEMHQIWRELGIIQGRQFIHHEEYARFEGSDGKELVIYTDPDRLERHMKDVAPEDGREITFLASMVRKSMGYPLIVGRAPELTGFLDQVRSMWATRSMMGFFLKYRGYSIADYAKRFKSPLLREALPFFFYPGMPFIFLPITLGSLASGDSGYPIGGSLPMSRAIEQRYLGLGGQISYRSRVKKILVENDRAVGVQLEDGSEHRADYVISAADGHSTIFEMLEGKYADDKVRGYYRDMELSPAIINVGLGFGRSWDELPKCVTGQLLYLPEPVTIGGKELRRLNVHFYNFDPTLAPPGKTVANVILEAGYDYWSELRQQDRERYAAEKEKVADQVIAALDRRYPGLAASVEMRDVAPQATYYRYTANWKGSFEGWLPNPKTLMMRMSKTLPGLDGFYMVGQWVEPGGGLPPAGYHGRHVTQLLCKRDGKQFRASEP